MKTVKFLSFVILLSLVWLGCEDRTKVKVEARDNREAVLDDAYTSSKTELNKSIAELRMKIDAKIEQAERDLEVASDDTKAEIRVRIDGLRKQKTDIEQLANRVANATAEGWNEFENEAAEVIADIKDAID